MEQKILELAEKLGAYLAQKGWKIAVAESCTGGGLCQAITEVAGSSEWFDRGFITYSNQAKMELLGVKADTLERFGAVSAETAREMAEGALRYSQANVAIAITGIAGPGGGSAAKPVGTVYIARSMRLRECRAEKKLFSGDRATIRRMTILNALQFVAE